MSEINEQVVQQMAELGRVHLAPEEVADATAKLEQILEHFTAIQKIDTTGVPPTDNATGLTNVWREDTANPEELLSHEEILERAPERHGPYIQVDAVL